MNSDEALALVRRVLSDTLGVEAHEVVPGAHLRDDLALDSLDAIDLVESLQAELGEPIEAAVIGKVATVQEVVDLVQRRSAARPSR
jgi:acyl carrier protein